MLAEDRTTEADRELIMEGGWQLACLNAVMNSTCISFMTKTMPKLKNSSGSWLTLFPNGLHLFVLSHVPGQLSSLGFR